MQDLDALIGKIASFRPLSPRLADQIRGYYRVGVTYSSNALEGNTLTEIETKVVLEDGLTIAGKPLREHYEAEGHAEAFDKMLELAQKKTISERSILRIHELFYHRIDLENAGIYRKVPVVIGGTEYVPPAPAKVPTRMKTFLARLPALRARVHPVEFAAHVHRGIVDIHPFVDGNGRTARLLMNLALLQAGYPIAIIPPVLRADYISLIKQSQTGPKDLSPFVSFISCMVYESAKDYLRILKATGRTPSP
jgi:Fic family protein